MALLRWLDVVLVLATAPFVLLADLPLLGYGVAAAMWIAQRILSHAIETRAHQLEDPRKLTGVMLGTTLARAWLVGLTILAVGLAGAREDGLMAAILTLAAFTVYFAMSLILRTLERKPVGS